MHGYQLPLCARCTGILFGQVLSLFVSFLLYCHWTMLLLIVPMAMDGLTQRFCRRESSNMIRVITGFIGGFGYIGGIVAVLKLALA